MKSKFIKRKSVLRVDKYQPHAEIAFSANQILHYTLIGDRAEPRAGTSMLTN